MSLSNDELILTIAVVKRKKAFFLLKLMFFDFPVRFFRVTKKLDIFKFKFYAK